MIYKTQTLAQLWGQQPRKSVLPPPSEEQRAIVEAVRGNNCVRITAYAGAGKTTTAMIIVCEDKKTNTIITYNRALADETRATIRELGLANVECHTYHGRVGVAAGKRGKVNNDSKLLAIVKQWDAGMPVAVPIATDRIILDEVQDMRPSFHRAVVHMVATHQPQMCLFGDANQILYDYGADDPAHTGFLMRPEEYFGHVTCRRAWVPATLNVSYRLTPRMAEFVNGVWGTHIVAGNMRSDLPVEYWHLSMYDARLVKRLKEVLDSYAAVDIAMLSPTNLHSADGKERPLQTIVNKLLLETCPDGRRRYNFAVKKPDAGTSAYKNKVRAWTHHASKGCTIKVTVVFGFNAFQGKQPNKNQMGVAISRSNHRLIVVHEARKDGAQPYCEPLNAAVMRSLVERGIVVAPDGIPDEFIVPQLDLPSEMIPVTGITHLGAATADRLLLYGTDVSRIGAQHDVAVSLTHRFHTGSRETEEDVSAIYGVAIPFAMEYRQTGAILNVESILNPVLVDAMASYTPDLVIALLKRTLTNLTLENTTAIRAAFAPPKTRGVDVIQTLRRLRPRCPCLANVAVSDRRRFDQIFAEHHLQRVGEIYARPVKTPPEFMYLANAYMAVEGTHELFVQIGDEYNWVNSSAFQQAVDILLTHVPSGEYEQCLSAAVTPPVHGSRRIVTGVLGCLDVQVTPTFGYELKFVHELSIEYELQALLYAAILAANADAAARCILFNARNGEQVVKEIRPKEASLLLREAAACGAGM